MYLSLHVYQHTYTYARAHTHTQRTHTQHTCTCIALLIPYPIFSDTASGGFWFRVWVWGVAFRGRGLGFLVYGLVHLLCPVSPGQMADKKTILKWKIIFIFLFFFQTFFDQAVTSITCGQMADKQTILKWKILSITNELASVTKEVSTHMLRTQ